MFSWYQRSGSATTIAFSYARSRVYKCIVDNCVTGDGAPGRGPGRSTSQTLALCLHYYLICHGQAPRNEPRHAFASVWRISEPRCSSVCALVSLTPWTLSPCHAVWLDRRPLFIRQRHAFTHLAWYNCKALKTSRPILSSFLARSAVVGCMWLVGRHLSLPGWFWCPSDHAV